MNVASKLGEDVAGRGEILLSSAARERVASRVGRDGNPRAAVGTYLRPSAALELSFNSFIRPWRNRTSLAP